MNPERKAQIRRVRTDIANFALDVARAAMPVALVAVPAHILTHNNPFIVPIGLFATYINTRMHINQRTRGFEEGQTGDRRYRDGLRRGFALGVIVGVEAERRKQNNTPPDDTQPSAGTIFTA